MNQLIIILISLLSFSAKAQLMPDNMVEVYDELSMLPFDKKFKKLDGLIKKKPNEPWYYWIAASIYTIKGDDSLVIVNYKKSIEVDSNFAAGHGSYARFITSSEKPDLDLALKHINRAIELDKDPVWHIDKGEIFRYQKKYEEAIQEANIALKSNEVDPQMGVKLIVQSIQDSGDKERLRNYITKVDLTNLGGFMDSNFDLLLGKLYAEYGDMEKACKCFNFAAEPYTLMEEEIPSAIVDALKKCE